MDIEKDVDASLVLGWPFMKTVRMMIDIDDGLMKARVQHEEASFNIFAYMKHLKDKGVCFKLDATNESIMDVGKKCTYRLLWK